jgi:hypothetical protein
MTAMTASAEMEAGYENLVAVCPRCGARNVYNRASDIGHFSSIANMLVACEKKACRASFSIYGDLVNPAHEMMLLDATAFLHEKRCIQAVLSATTAYELFFSHFLRVELVYRASTRDRTSSEDRITWMNTALAALKSATERLTFEGMRRLFLRTALEDFRPSALADADAYISGIPKGPPKPPRVELESLEEPERRELLLRVHDTQIARLRNDVVHKSAYRPRIEQASSAVGDAERTIFLLGQHYNLASDNYHLNESPDDL